MTTNKTQLLIEVWKREPKFRQDNHKPNESCVKCLTEWKSGQFDVVEVVPSNHRRKTRRQHRIERLQKAIKAAESTLVTRRLSRQLKRLQQQNNHILVYKCKICGESNRVLAWKPKPTTPSCTDPSESKKEEPASNPKRKKGKKAKTAGLILPQSSRPSAATSQKQLSMAKLSALLQPQSESQKSKLNQFLS